MKHNEVDRRVLKTRLAIHEALSSLMQEKRYNKITIQDIIDRANVGRSTFYSHFATKDELLFNSVEHVLEMLNDYIKSYVEYDGDTNRLIPVVEFFEHIQEHSKMIKGLFRTEGADLFFERAETYWNEGIEEYLQAKMPIGTEPRVPIRILTNHISSTLINLLKWWVNNDMSYTPIQMEQYFRDLINPCIDSVMHSHSPKG